MRIAALDDEPGDLELIRYAMEDIGYKCHGFIKAKPFLRALRQQSYDLLILDWILPDVQGPRVVRSIREELKNPTPILFVTHRREEQDLVEGLAAGADDFMVKPIRVAELQARVRALLRRAYPVARDANQHFGDYQFSAPARELRLRGQLIELSHREYALAFFLFQNTGRLLSRDHLREAVWGDTGAATSRTLDTHISRLRIKLELAPANGLLLSAVYGHGYRLEWLDTPGAPGAPAAPSPASAPA
jgi:DNA-binding response OmpR family regulator